MKNKHKIQVVAGPTASGKSKFAANLAKQNNGILVNFDSVQFYKHLNIGANKDDLVKPSEMELATSYLGNRLPVFKLQQLGTLITLVDFMELETDFTIFEFQKLCREVCLEIIELGKNPILVGGSGLYLDALVKEYDPESSDMAKPEENNFEFEIFYPEFEREKLYEKINARVDEMFDEGLVEETKAIFFDSSKKIATKLYKTSGYRYVIEYLNGEISLEDCKSKVKQGHRNYAKRQITWFEGEARGYDLVKTDFTPQ